MPQVFDTPITTTDQSLDRVLAAGLPVALVFVDGASSLDDTLNRLARQYAGQALLVKINARENPASARRYQVRATPALVTVKSQATVTQAEPISAAELEQHLAYLLGQGPRPTAKPASSAAHTSTAGANGAGPAATAGAPLTVTDATFEQQVLRSPEPVLIDFWAPWCGPCHMVAPTVEKLARELSGRLRVVKINVDENPRVSGSYGVQSIPTMLIVKNGQVADRWMGAQPEGAIRARVNRALG
jgi:thioredoxin 1